MTRQLTLDYGPGLPETGTFAVIRDDGTVIGDNELATEYRKEVSEMDFTLPPDDRLLKFVGSPTFVIVHGPEDAHVIAAIQQLEFGDVEGHPFHGNQWTGGRGGGDEPSGNRKKTEAGLKINEKFEGRLITDTSDSTALSQRIDEITKDMPGGLDSWLIPPMSLNDKREQVLAEIQNNPNLTEAQKAFATDFAEWRVEADKAGQGYTDQPGNYGLIPRPEAIANAYDPKIAEYVNQALSTPYGTPPYQWKAETSEETLEKVKSEIYNSVRYDRTSFDPADPQTWTNAQADAIGHAEFVLGTRENDPIGEGENNRYQSAVERGLNPPDLVVHTDQLNDQLLRAEATTREVGQAVLDRAAEIRDERGLKDLDEVRGEAQKAFDREQDALAGTRALNASFGLPPYFKLADAEQYGAWGRMTDEGRAGYTTLYNEMGTAAATAEAEQASAELRSAELDRRESIFAALRETREFGPGDTGGFKTLRANDYAAAAVRSAERYYPTEWIRESNKGTTMDVRETNGRGFYRQQGQGPEGGSDLRYSSESSVFGERFTPVMAHELGHRMESTLPELSAAEFAHWARRTEGDDTAKLGAGYRPNEITKADDFFDKYAGKSYGGRTSSSYEVFTMGIQSLVQRGYVGTTIESTASPKTDPELEHFILGILATAGKTR